MGWVFDPNHSQVEWACRYLGISVIKGAFEQVKAEVNVEDSDPAKWSISAEIEPNSLTSPGFVRRPEALRGENFLEADKFPVISFRGSSVKANGKQLEITGDLTLHGVTRQVTLTGSDNGEAIDRRDIRRRGFSGRTSIRRTDYDIPATGPRFVGDEVDISLEIQLIRED